MRKFENFPFSIHEQIEIEKSNSKEDFESLQTFQKVDEEEEEDSNTRQNSKFFFPSFNFQFQVRSQSNYLQTLILLV